MQCASDQNCKDTEQCLNQQCVQIDCPDGRIVSHTCQPYQCTQDRDCRQGYACVSRVCRPSGCGSDADCSADQYCSAGSCKPVALGSCGQIKDHVFVPYGYECGPEAGCPSCKAGFTCANHKCVKSDLSCPTTGIVGDNKTCEAKENNQPCMNCDYRITDPTGKSYLGKTDENGNLVLPLNLEGTYNVTLLSNGTPIKTIQIKALPRAPPTEEVTPTILGIESSTFMWLLALVLLVVGYIIYSRRKGGKGGPKPKEKK